MKAFNFTCLKVGAVLSLFFLSTNLNAQDYFSDDYYERKDPSQIRLGFSAPQLANPFFVGVKMGIEKFCKEKGISCTIYDASYNESVQVNDVSRMIADGYDGILVTPINAQSIEPLFDKAKAQHIATGSLAQIVPNSNLIYALNEYDYGYVIGSQAATWAKKVLNCKGKVAIINQDNVKEIIPRSKGIANALTEVCPLISIVANKSGDNPTLGERIIAKVLKEHPDLNLVVATNDSGGIGAYNAMVKAKAYDSKRAIFSGDATREVLYLMNNKASIYQGTVDLFPFQGGYEAAKYLFEMVVLGIPEDPVVDNLYYTKVSKEDILKGKYFSSY